MYVLLCPETKMWLKTAKNAKMGHFCDLPNFFSYCAQSFCVRELKILPHLSQHKIKLPSKGQLQSTFQRKVIALQSHEAEKTTKSAIKNPFFEIEQNRSERSCTLT